MLILNRTLHRISGPTWIRYSTQIVSEPTVKKKKEMVVNFKYGPKQSDPLYESLIYSTEVDVYLTAKKGKAWLEMQAAKKFLTDNERRQRERAALAKPVPLALQYLYGESQKVQKEEDVTANEEIDVVEEIAGSLEAGQASIPPVFPYGVFDPINDNVDDELENQSEKIDDISSSSSSRGKRKRRLNSKATESINNR